MKTRFSLILLMSLLPTVALALGPHEVLLLVNSNSLRSIAVAEHFARLRGVPECNIVKLSMPEDRTVPQAISQADFTRLIWDPAVEATRQRGIEDHILAWVYSVDFPVRITTNPPLSITGLTFIRNRYINSDQVNGGSYTSPLFAGPDSPVSRSFKAQSFDVSRAWLGEEMPLPAMMLGVVGERGNSLETVLDCIRSGVESDGTRPGGTVYFVTGDDIRARSRQWEFASAQRELFEAGVSAVITNSAPRGQTNIVGIMMGLANVTPKQYGRFAKGAIADHLTSAAAVFGDANQTKISEWIEAGVTASAGTVTEPFAKWAKFPHARLYVHYASGRTAIESIFQAVRCPLQLLVVGEPLAAPWKPEATISLTGIGGQPVSGILSASAEVSTRSGCLFTRYVFLLDGRVIPGWEPVKATQEPAGNTIRIDTTSLSDGTHKLRVVAYSAGSARHQVLKEQEFVVKNGEAK